MSAVRYLIPNQDVAVRQRLVTAFGNKITEIVMEFFSHDICILQRDYESKSSFYLYSETMERSLAMLDCSWYRQYDENRFGYPSMIIPPCIAGGTYGGIERVPNICIELLKVDHKWYNSGFASYLIQAVIEWSSTKNCQGKVTVQAAYNSHWWYYIKGFHSAQRNKNIYRSTNQQIEKALSLAKKRGLRPNTKALGSIEMELSDEGAKKWMETIKNSPLLQNPQELVAQHEAVVYK